MCSTRQDQRLLGGIHVRGRDGLRAVGDQSIHDDARQGVHQERLPLGPPPGPVDRLLGEDLPGLGGVLGIQRGHVVSAEVGQGERGGLDVERRAGVHRPAVLRLHQVVPQVAHPDEGNGRGEAPRQATRKPGPELAEEADHGRALHHVGLVQQEHEGAVAEALAPGRKPPREAAAGFLGNERTRGDGLLFRRQGPLRPRGDGPNPDRLHARDIGDPLALLQGGDQGDHALPPQPLRQRVHGRRLAGLARSVQGEILLSLDELIHVGQPGFGRQHEVVVRVARAGVVEETGHERSLQR